MKVTITFEVTDKQYHDYERDINCFLDRLYLTGIEDVDVTEHENDGVVINRDIICEIDSELFFNNISMDTKSWSYDYDDLAENTEVFEYIKEYYPKELQALKDGRTDYITVYYD